MKRRRFSRQFKLEAVRLLKNSDKTGAELARELGVRRNQLYKWRDQVELRGEADAFPGGGRNAAKDNRSELTQLRQRIGQLEEENAILKKAEAYFTGKHR
jgi:transposase-like protein